MILDRFDTTNLTLRPFTEDDAGAVFAYWSSDSGWERFNASVPSNFTPYDAESFVAEMSARSREDRPNWAVVQLGVVVGVVSLTFEQHFGIAVVGYGVHGDLRGRGFAVEAAGAVIDQAFAKYPQLQRIRAHTDLENASSMRVLEKLGFTHEGTLRSNQFVKGRFCDEVVFGLLREEWIRSDK